MAKETVGQRIRMARTAKGLSQRRLADLAGVSQQQIDKIERGQTRFSLTLPVLAAALDIDVPLPRGLALAPGSAGKRRPNESVNADTVVACLTAYVREHGKREGPLDSLLPPERQEEGIARAMELIEYLSREDSADA